MGDVSAYSTTAASNSTIDGINVAEGCNASGINDAIRAFMADVRNSFNDAAWFQYGVGTGSPAPTYLSATSFKQPGVDVTTPYHAGRRVKAVGATTGTIYGSISSSSFSADTTVNVTWDSGSLANESLTIYLSQTPVTGKPLSSSSLVEFASGTFTPIDSSGAALVLTNAFGYYRKVGTMVTVWGSFSVPANGSALAVTIGGLPFTAANLSTQSNEFPGVPAFTGLFSSGGGGPYKFNIPKNTTTMVMRDAGGTAITNTMLATWTVHFSITYPI